MGRNKSTISRELSRLNLTPINKNLSRALLLTASLMTTIIQAGVNLAYGKQATQSSDFSSTLVFLDYKARHLSPELLLKINSFY
jgi:hypothetical protein